MAQPVFSDPQVISVVADPGNTGNGVLTITKLTHFTLTQEYVVTAIQSTPNPVFSVVGSIDGPVGLATENVEFKDEDLKIFFLITPGATGFEIGDFFTINVEQGTDLNQANIDTYDELPQKNFSDDNDDNLRYDDVEKTYSFNVDEVTDPGGFFEGNGLVQARDFLTHQADTYPFVTLTSQKETGDETLFRKLLKITDNEPEDTAVNVAAASVTRADGTEFKLLNKNGAVIDFTGGTIDFATGTGTNLTSFTPVNLSPNEFVRYGISLDNEDPAQLFITPGIPNAVEGSLEDPTLPTGFTKIGFVTVQDDGTGGVGNILDIGRDKIIQLTVSNEGSEDEGLIQDILNLQYAARIIDELDDNDAINDTETTAAFSSGQYSVQYSNKVITVAANNVTIGVAAPFTVQVGDVIVQGTAHTKITTVNSQTDFDVADGSVLTTGVSATISQLVETVNLPLFGDAESRSRDFIATDITQALVWYEDGEFQDTPNDPEIAFSISSNQTFYTDAETRPNDFISQHTATVIPDTNESNDLIVRFFSNETSGDGTSTLKSYRIYYHLRTVSGALVGTELVTEITTSTQGISVKNNSGGVIDALRIVRPDGSGDPDRTVVLADKASFATGLGIGITINSMNDQEVDTIVREGIIEDANLTLGFSDGAEVFLGASGVISDIAPATPGEYQLIIGRILGDDLLVAIENKGVL